jgi:hypothetical protein
MSTDSIVNTYLQPAQLIRLAIKNGIIDKDYDIANLEGTINCELPNNAIYKFEGNLELNSM